MTLIEQTLAIPKVQGTSSCAGYLTNVYVPPFITTCMCLLMCHISISPSLGRGDWVELLYTSLANSMM